MFLCAVLAWAVASAEPPTDAISAAGYPSVQAAIDANPGKMVFVPGGDFEISQKLRIASDGSGLYGFGRIIQTNPQEPVLEIEHARNVRVRDLTLTRAPGKEDATANGVFCWDSSDVVLEGLRVLECRARHAAIEIRECTNCTVRNCQILSYKRIAVDDRTGPGENLYGYAFFAIDGTGILVNRCTGTVIESNRIVEERLLPTREAKEQHQLGKLTEGRYPSKQGKLAAAAFANGYVNNWHQGSAIVVTAPEETRHTIVRGNYIENAAQGIDLHTDCAVVADNVVNHGMMGIKGTHGCRNLIISGNLLTHVDLWGILLNPGAGSHAAEPASEDRPARPANVDGGIIVSNNIVTDYGRGHEYWNWGGAANDLGGSYAIALYGGQLDTNPPLRDVLVTGNIVYDTGRDGVVAGGEVRTPAPRYRYAVYLGGWDGEVGGPTCPKDVRFVNNVFHPGAQGVSNVELTP